jgi:outer membrane lipoprotein carrier protein
MNRSLLAVAVAATATLACTGEPARTGGADGAAGPQIVAEVAVDSVAGVTPQPTPGMIETPAASDHPAGVSRDAEQPQQPQPQQPQPQQPAQQQQPAQPAADEGATALRQASAAYESVRSLRADFVMSFDNPLLRETTTSRGTIYQRQPDRIAIRFSDPAGDVVLSDGQYFWVYYPSVNAQQVMRSPAAAGGETGVNLQAQFVGNPVERFRYDLHGTEAVAGRAARVLTLVPRQRAEYRSLKVWIDTRDGLVRRFELTEHNGNVRRFELQNLQTNPTISEAVFQFSPPPGARIIDAG